MNDRSYADYFMIPDFLFDILHLLRLFYNYSA